MSEPSQMVVRVAIAISGAPFPSPASIRKARSAIEAMRMTHEAGDALDIIQAKRAWNAGIDAALASPPKE